MAGFLLLFVCLLAAAFAFLNGFRDASSAVAVAVRTRSLTPTVAVLLAGLFNLVGALLSVSFTVALSQELFTLPPAVLAWGCWPPGWRPRASGASTSGGEATPHPPPTH